MHIEDEEALRDAFWEAHPEFHRHNAGDHPKRDTQNDYNATIRSEWCFFVDCMCKDGQISEELAEEAIL